MPRKPLKLPAVSSAETRVRFYETDDFLVLTDVKQSRRIALGAFAAAMITTSAAAVLWLFYLDTLPNQHRTADQVFWGLTVIVLAVFAFVVMLLIVLAKGWYRSFKVRVDVPRQSCRCSHRVFGIPVRKRYFDTVYTEWDAASQYIEFQHTRQDSDNTGAAFLAALLLGPLGLILGALFYSRRNRNREKTWTGQAAVQLRAFDRNDTFALITVPEETVAQEFLLAWDRRFSR